MSEKTEADLAFDEWTDERKMEELRTIVWELAEELLDADCPSHGDVPVSVRDCAKGPCNRIAAMCPRRHALTRARKAGIIGDDG